jgi:hypothetical protein
VIKDGVTTAEDNTIVSTLETEKSAVETGVGFTAACV